MQMEVARSSGIDRDGNPPRLLIPVDDIKSTDAMLAPSPCPIAKDTCFPEPLAKAM